MNVLYATLTATVFTLSLAGAAGAVDLHNTNKSDTEIGYASMTVTENGQTRHINLADGEFTYGICAKCTIRLGSQEVAVSDHDMVEVTGGSLKVSKYPVPVRQQAMLPSSEMPASGSTAPQMTATQADSASDAPGLPGNDPIVGGSDD